MFNLDEAVGGFPSTPITDEVPRCRHTLFERHGTTTLFAALDVDTGLVKASHYRRHRRVEFLDFMNRLVAAHPGRELHVILDDLNTHKPKHDRWLARHKTYACDGGLLSLGTDMGSIFRGTG